MTLYYDQNLVERYWNNSWWKNQ